MLKWAKSNARILSMVIGSVFMSIWTMIRFFSKSSNFDLVGQQVLAHQWLSGPHGGAIVGPTNYILKIIFLYMPVDVLPLPERLKLIVITLLVNIITFICIVLILERIWLEFYPKIPKIFYAAMLWLALTAGSVFWIQFTNSRNLEAVGGLLLVYLLIRLRTKQSNARYAVIALISGILFFADPLQLYMSAIPACIFLFANLMITQRSNKKVPTISVFFTVGALLIGFAISKVVAWMVQMIFGVEFSLVVNQRGGSDVFKTVFDSIVPTIKQTARLYTGGHELGRYVVVLNLLFVCAVVTISIFFAWQRLISRKLFALISTVTSTDIMVYILSGQALQGGTSRYLIMTVPFFILLTAMVISSPSKVRKSLVSVMILILAINSSDLVISLIKNWNGSFTNDVHITSASQYMQSNSYYYGYASMDTALPVEYYSGGSVRLLPIMCEAGNIVKPVFLFFDRKFYVNTYNTNQSEVPFILDDRQIANSPNTCNMEAIRKSFGDWKSTTRLSDNSVVLVYDASQFRKALNTYAQ